jgi:hypothetical protein
MKFRRRGLTTNSGGKQKRLVAETAVEYAERWYAARFSVDYEDMLVVLSTTDGLSDVKRLATSLLALHTVLTRQWLLNDASIAGLPRPESGRPAGRRGPAGLPQQPGRALSHLRSASSCRQSAPLPQSGPLASPEGRMSRVFPENTSRRRAGTGRATTMFDDDDHLIAPKVLQPPAVQRT